jgi:DNA invertase Pin-like site-specific DNA recombinase
MKVGLYARVSTHDQQTLALQREAMEAYVQQRAWEIAVLVEEIGSGGRERWQREALMRAARRRDINAIVVWRLDRWGRSFACEYHRNRKLRDTLISLILLCVKLYHKCSI